MNDWIITDSVQQLRVQCVNRVQELVTKMRWTNAQYASFIKMYYGVNSTHPSQSMTTHQLRMVIPIMEGILEKNPS